MKARKCEVIYKEIYNLFKAVCELYQLAIKLHPLIKVKKKRRPLSQQGLFLQDQRD